MAECRIETTCRNPFEQNIAKQLIDDGLAFDYEALNLPVTIPSRVAKYKPDFTFRDCNIIIEGKGAFGGGHAHYNSSSAAARQKMLLVKEQHPHLDIRFVFSNPNAKIYKGSKTTYAKWADDHGFKWSKKTVPREWLNEIKEAQRGANKLARTRACSGRKDGARNRRGGA